MRLILSRRHLVQRGLSASFHIYIPDLTRHEELPNAPPATYLAVGWLNSNHPFPQGSTPEEFRRKLAILGSRPVRLMRGFHTCEWCPDEEVRGNGEIHVPVASGEILVAPAMIAHYVECHRYLPPDVFITALERLPLDAG